MKQIIRYALTLLLLIAASGMRAQDANILSISDVSGSMGSKVALPIYLSNTCNDIVAVQFRLTLSNGLTLDTKSAQFGVRTSNHRSVVQKNGNSYVVMVFSSNNSAIAGNAGQLMTIDLNIPTGLTPGGEYSLTMSEVLLSNKAGENVLTSFNSGILHIAEVPDFVVSDIQATTTDVLAPGDAISVAWTVKNQGGKASTGGWSEQVSLVGSGRTQLLGTVYHDEPLSAGATVSRQADLLIPALPGIDGQAKVQVKLVPNADSGEMSEHQGNNTTQSEQAVSLSKYLTLTVPPTATEGSKTLKCVLARSGSWTVAQTFNLSIEGDSRLSAPATVTIPRGQASVSFNLTINDDNLLNANSHFTIQASGNGYDAVTAQTELEDNEYPTLSLTASKTDITEGETFQLTVTAPAPVSEATEVLLYCEKPAKFIFPASVTIAKGETTATVTIEARDDSDVNEATSIAFIAEATGYSRAETVILLADNDMPDIELTLTPATVSESAGASAVIGTVRKLNHKDSKITVKLSDNTKGRLYYSTTTLVIEAGVEEAQFTIGVKDNASADGDITAKVTAAIWISSCSCSANATSGGSVTKTFTIVDDDGPSLKLTAAKTTMLEGSQDNILTIERNTSLTTALTVTLSSNHDDDLTYNHTVTLPIGQQSMNVSVVVAANAETGDNRTVAFTATADGYASGTCWVMITDRTQPDVSLSELTTNSQSYESGGQMEVSVKVTNSGNAVFPAPAKILLSLDNNSNTLSPMYLTEDLQPGTSAIVRKTVTLPAGIGSRTLKAEINHNHAVEELLYANNISENVTINLLPLFTATVTPDKSSYTKGETITLNGKATGSGAADTEVEVYIIQGSIRQTITAKTDGEGNFSADWTPYSSQMGQFVVGACFPGENLTTGQAIFNILGLRRTTTGYITCETLVDETYSGNIIVENPGALPQTFSSLEVLKQPANCEVTFTKPTSVNGGATATISYTLKGSAVTEGNNWEDLQIRLTTAEGSVLDIDMYYYCRSPKAILETSISSINTTMVKGQSREYSLTVGNRGMGATGTISLSLPDVEWMKAATPIEMGSLNYEETTEIILRLTPTDDMPLNVPITGRIALNCENGNGITVPYRIEPVSESTGTLVVDVTDEYTYYTVVPEESGSRRMARAASTSTGPHVAGATVEVRHPVTNAIVASGQTGSDGKFSMDLPEGYYTLAVTESNHNSYSGTVLVDPGTSNLQNIFIGFKAITYSWEVEETEVEDEYQMKTTVKYETNVPKPVVIITLPTEEPQPNTIIPVTVTNKGLITANNPIFELTTTEGYEIELLNGEDLKTLAPQQSYVFYALFKPTATQNARRRALGDGWNGSCKGLYAELWLSYICGTEEQIINQMAAGRWGNCGGTIMSGGAGATWGGGSQTTSPGGPGNGGGGGPIAPYTIYHKATSAANNNDGTGTSRNDTNCNAFLRNIAEALGDCVSGIITNCMPDAVGGAYEAYKRKYDDLMDRIRKASIEHAPKEELEGLLKQLAEVIADWNNLSDKYECASTIGGCVATLQNLYNGGAASRAQRSAAKANDMPAIGTFIEQFDMLRQEIEALDLFNKELYGDEAWMESDNEERTAFLTALSDNASQGVLVLTDEVAALRPENISYDQASAFVERLNNTVLSDENDAKINLDQLEAHLESVSEVESYAVEQGYDNTNAMLQSSYQDAVDFVDGKNSSVCASITLQFSQTMTMTRQAFRGTLTVFNGHDTEPMQDVKLNLEVRDEDGTLATTHEFQISAESLKQFNGELSLTSGWTLGAQQTGTATILFIPTKYAAPTENKVYSFGGTLSYVDPFTGLTIARTLYPVSLTVKPSPNLELTYFMQRDIMGDDALTLDAVEPSEPAEFSLVIKNNGNGEATNVRMVTDQPRIIDNEKGLYIDFSILCSILNGKETALALGQSVATNFGNIAPQSTTYAQWMFQSSLLGHFTEYNVEATHVSSYDNPDLALLDGVTIHELIHGFDMELQEGNAGRAFLVNDIPDTEDKPDAIYFTDGTQLPLAIASNAVVTQISDTEYRLSVNGTANSWNYGTLADPTAGRQKLKTVVRQRDGKQLSPESFWQTDRTLRDSKEWLYEYKLHFADNFEGTQENYVLTYELVPDLFLAVENFSGIPSINDIAKEPVNTIEVTFNKDIDVNTFTTEDLQLNCQGEVLDATLIGISQTESRKFSLDLSALTSSDGYYTLTIQTAGITDSEGFEGQTGRKAEWIQYAEKVSYTIKVSPEEGGTVTPESRLAEYGETVNLEAIPNVGYEFTGWSENDIIVSRDAEYELTVVPNKLLTATFVPHHYYVSIDCDSSQGNIAGANTGIYPYGTQMELTAVPAKGYVLKEWTVDGVIVENDTITITVTEAHTIQAAFVQKATYLPGDANGDGNINIGDVMAVYSYILEDVPEGFVPEAADLNGDGSINIADIFKLYDHILEQE